MALNESNQGGRPTGSAERDPGLDRLYRAAGREDPPAHLDAAILAAARREVGARPRTLPPALRRWHVPVSIAAVVVLSVSLVMLVREEGGEQLMQAPPPAPAEPPVAQPAQPAPVLPETERARPPAAAPATLRPAQREEVPADAPVALGKMADSAASGVAPMPSQAQGAGAASAPDAAARSQPQPFRDAPSPAERRAAAPQAAPAEDVAARASAAAERGVAPMAAAPAPEPARARAMVQARKEVAPGNDKLPVWQGFEKEPPQKWLEKIAELKQQKRAIEAEAMLAEFKRRFPNHPLPPGLQ